MTQHTPGPWEIEYNDPNEEYWVTEPHYDAGPAKIVYHIEDARLIAAAPDLLAVCQELEESASYWSEYYVPLGIVDRLKAAIAKATGEKNGN
jgi:hypothetical protein